MEDKTKAAASKTRVLCIGFSVTEMLNSYVPRADEISRNLNLPYEFHKCGIGGIGLETLAYLIDDIFDMHADFKNAVFEIATGAGRNEFSERRRGLNDLALLRCVEQIALAGLRRGVSLGFLNLPRLDADYAQDHFELSVLAVGSVYGIPVQSVTYKALLEPRDLDALLPDKVHVNLEGANYYAQSLIELVSNGLSRVAVRGFHPRTFFCTNLAHDSGFPSQLFARHGYSSPMTQVGAGQSLEWRSANEIVFQGITFQSGPATGKFDVHVDGAAVATIQTYDQYCYYDRFNSAFFPPTRGTTLTLTVRDEMPTISLLKGQPNLGPRIVPFGHVLYRHL